MFDVVSQNFDVGRTFFGALVGGAKRPDSAKPSRLAILAESGDVSRVSSAFTASGRVFRGCVIFRSAKVERRNFDALFNDEGRSVVLDIARSVTLLKSHVLE